jgi:hypothetical protein
MLLSHFDIFFISSKYLFLPLLWIIRTVWNDLVVAGEEQFAAVTIDPVLTADHGVRRGLDAVRIGLVVTTDLTSVVRKGLDTVRVDLVVTTDLTSVIRRELSISRADSVIVVIEPGMVFDLVQWDSLARSPLQAPPNQILRNKFMLVNEMTMYEMKWHEMKNPLRWLIRTWNSQYSHANLLIVIFEKITFKETVSRDFRPLVFS